MVQRALDERPDLIKLRLRAPLPPEVIEPLIAFRGDTNYNFDPRTRLTQKLQRLFVLISQWTQAELPTQTAPTTPLNYIPHIADRNSTVSMGHVPTADSPPSDSTPPASATPLPGDSRTSIDDAVIQSRGNGNPQVAQFNDHTASNSTNDGIRYKLVSILTQIIDCQNRSEQAIHPFDNHIGFHSQTPQSETAGGIEMGKPISDINMQQSVMRYPTLQREARSLSEDPQYREGLQNAIDILERQPQWPLELKLTFIRRLRTIFESVPSSAHVDEVLDQALPLYRKDEVKHISKLGRGKRGEGNQGPEPRFFYTLTTRRSLVQRKAELIERRNRKLVNKERKAKAKAMASPALNAAAAAKKQAEKAKSNEVVKMTKTRAKKMESDKKLAAKGKVKATLTEDAAKDKPKV